MNDLLYEASLSAGTTFSDNVALDGHTEKVKTVVITSSISGATVTITPQTSNDAENWIDLDVFTAITTNTTVQEDTDGLLAYFRLKIVVAGGTVDLETVTAQKVIESGEDTLDTLEAIQAATEATQASVEIMDDWDNAASNGAKVSGDTPHGTTDAGEPVGIGGVARDPASLPTPVTLGQRVKAMFDKYGRFIMSLGTALNSTDDSIASHAGASSTVDGCSTHFDADADNTAQEMKPTAGNLYGLELTNENGVDAWIQLFDLPVGSVTVGTTTPKQSYIIPGSGAMDKDFGAAPISFDTAITYAVTTSPTGSGDPTIGLTLNGRFK